jgi:tRNA (guanine-N7-)-methyltransferase
MCLQSLFSHPMGKNKLKRFRENLDFPNLVQPVFTYPAPDHELKGKWSKEFFKNENPLVLELGCGRGEYTLSLATKFPETNVIGIDWKGARLWRGAKTAFEAPISNAGFLRIQIQNIAAFFGENEVSEIWITFPDPQMQKTREKKRLVARRFLDSYRKFMKADGIIHLKTDSRPFYDYALEVIDAENLKIEFQTNDLYNSGFTDEILSVKTTYENMWLAEGAKICYVRFRIFP